MSQPADSQFLLGQIHADVRTLLDRTAAFDTRLTAVERKVWWATGAVAVISAYATHLFYKYFQGSGQA